MLWPWSSSPQTLAGSVALPLLTDWQVAYSLLLFQIPRMQKGDQLKPFQFYSYFRSTSLNVSFEKPRIGSNMDLSDYLRVEKLMLLLKCTRGSA